MKAKLLFILLSVLFIIPMEAATLKTQRHKTMWRVLHKKHKIVTRSPFVFDMGIRETDSCLQIIFLSPLPDAEITITDKDRKIVIHESHTLINNDKILYIDDPNDYPYTVKIVSPIMDITGEIVKEESE